MERFVIQEGPNDERGADEGEGRAKPFGDLNRIELLIREHHLQCSLLPPKAQGCAAFDRLYIYMYGERFPSIGPHFTMGEGWGAKCGDAIRSDLFQRTHGDLPKGCRLHN